MPSTRTPQKRERNRVGGTRRVASEQLKRKGQGSEARALETFSSERPASECGLPRGKPQEGRSRRFHRSPQGDIKLLGFPFSPAGPQTGWTRQEPPHSPSTLASCRGQPGVLSAPAVLAPLPSAIPSCLESPACPRPARALLRRPGPPAHLLEFSARTLGA